MENAVKFLKPIHDGVYASCGFGFGRDGTGVALMPLSETLMGWTELETFCPDIPVRISS
jgi:hypothetical protein